MSFSGDESMIPRILHFIWIGPKPFAHREKILTYRKQNPDWGIKLWTDKNLPAIRNQTIYNELPIYASKADLLRLELLYLYGGVYADVDSWCRRPLDGLIQRQAIRDRGLFFTTSKKGRIEINLMGCTPRHPVIGGLLAGLPEYWRVFKERGGSNDRGKRSVYCIYTFIHQWLDGNQLQDKYVKLLRVYNCKKKEVSKKTFVVQKMMHSWKRRGIEND